MSGVEKYGQTSMFASAILGGKKARFLKLALRIFCREAAGCFRRKNSTAVVIINKSVSPNFSTLDIPAYPLFTC